MIISMQYIVKNMIMPEKP